MTEYVKSLVENLYKESDFYEQDLEIYPYVEKLATFLGLEDAADLYAFYNRALFYDSLDDVKRHESSMDDWEFEIYKRFFEKFGKLDEDFTEEDFKKFNSNQKEYDEFHSTLK